MADLLGWIGLYLAALCLLGAAAISVWMIRSGLAERAAHLAAWDSTEDQVARFADELHVDNDDRIRRAERAGEFAEAMTLVLTTLERRAARGQGRHRAVGLRDPRRPTWQRPTAAFAAIALAETGQPLKAVGPREADLRPGWTQPALEEVT